MVLAVEAIGARLERGIISSFLISPQSLPDMSSSKNYLLAQRGLWNPSFQSLPLISSSPCFSQRPAQALTGVRPRKLVLKGG